MFNDKRCEIKCVFPYVVGRRIMSIHISRDMYLCFGLHVQIRLYYVLPYKAKNSAQYGKGFILDRCIVYLGLTVPNLQKKRLLIFEIFNIKKCRFFFGTEYIYDIAASVPFIVTMSEKENCGIPWATSQSSSVYMYLVANKKGIKSVTFFLKKQGLMKIHGSIMEY